MEALQLVVVRMLSWFTGFTNQQIKKRKSDLMIRVRISKCTNSTEHNIPLGKKEADKRKTSVRRHRGIIKLSKRWYVQRNSIKEKTKQLSNLPLLNRQEECYKTSKRVSNSPKLCLSVILQTLVCKKHYHYL